MGKKDEGNSRNRESYFPEMIIRLAKNSDLPKIEKIYKKFYEDKFELEFKNFLCSYVVELNGEIISFGGIRVIAESLLLTNRDSPVRMRYDAILKLLAAGEMVAKENHFDQIHAFPEDDETWKKMLKKLGFEKTKYDAYVRFNNT